MSTNMNYLYYLDIMVESAGKERKEKKTDIYLITQTKITSHGPLNHINGLSIINHPISTMNLTVSSNRE